MKLVFESCSPRRMLFRRLYNQPVVSKQLAGVPNSSTGPSLPPQQSFCSSVNSPLKGVEDFLDMGIYWLLLPRQIVTSVSPFWTRWTWTAMNDLNRHCANFLHPFSSSFYVKLKVKLNDIAETWWEGGWSCVELDNVVQHPSPLQTPQMQVTKSRNFDLNVHIGILCCYPTFNNQLRTAPSWRSVHAPCFWCWNPSSGKGTAVFVLFVSKSCTIL